MAAPDKVSSLLARLHEVAPSGFFDRDASELLARVPDRVRGGLAYLAKGDGMSARALLSEEKLSLLSDETVEELGKSLVALASREAERQAAGVRAIVFRPRVQTNHAGPPAGKTDVGPWLERLGAQHLAGERAKPFIRDTLDPRILVRTPFELTVEEALAANWGQGSVPSWVLMPVRDAVAKAVAESNLLGAPRTAESWPDPPLSPVLGSVFELLLREHGRIGVPTKSLAFRAHVDPGELVLSLAYDHGGRGATLMLGEAHLGLVSFDTGSDAASRKRILEVALDALTDTGHPLHAPLRQLLEEPAWERTLRRLSQFVRERDARRDQALDRIAFRVFRDERLEVQALRQKPMAGGGWSRGTRELGALSELQPESQERYARFARAVRESSGRFEGPAFAVLPGMPNVVSASGEPLTVRSGRARVTAHDAHGGITLMVRIGTAPEMTFPAFVRDAFDGERTAVVYDEERLSLDVAEVPMALGRLSRVLMSGAATIPRTELQRLEPLLFALAGEVPFEWPGSLRGETVEADPRLHIYLVALPLGGEVHVRFRPLAAAPDVVPGEGDVLIVAHDEGRRVSVTRALDHEHEAARTAARRLGLEAHPESAAFSYVIADDEPFLDVVLRARDEASALGIVVHWRSVERREVRGRISKANARVAVRTAQNWLALDGTVEIDGEKLALAEVLAALRARRRYVRLSDGSFAAIEAELRERLSALARASQEQGGELVVSPALLHIVQGLEEGIGEFVSDAGFRVLEDKMAELFARAIELPPGFTGTLRDYQIDGYRWLVRLATLGIGACLADEMGLGKTIQALALLLERSSQGPALVIAPTSVGVNWVDEAARFVPSLRVALYRGKDRSAQLDSLPPGTVLVTSYDIATLDIDRLAKVSWSTVILDEAQMLKNAGTQRGRAVRRLQSGARVALTGTPLENHLGELWSLFDVLTPGLFGEGEQFKERFSRPIELDGDTGAHEALRTLVRPFVLRRRKAEVAPELPARTEVLQPVELSEAERALYEAERAAGVQALLRPDGAAAAPQQGGDALRILAVISRLRQLACHPRLVHPESSAPSAKLTALLEVLEQVEREGGRALVFSEWTRLLALVENALSLKRVPYLYLDGETPALERAARVARFQAGEGKVFLLSLRAGGTGLNLTGADWVIHLDPWWNPAVEDQATDRAHRIGQTRPVTVVRLVAQGTIEEAVMGLHAHKRALATGVLEGTEAAGKMGTAELMDLLAGVETAQAETRRKRPGRARAAE